MMAATPELSGTLQKILRLAHQAIPFDKGAIHLLREGALWTRALWSVPHAPVDPNLLGARLEIDQGFCGYVARQGKPFLSPVVAEEKGIRPANYHGSNLLICSFLGVPLRLEGEIIGVLEMDSLTPNFFQPHHVELAEVVADQAAIAIHSARLAEEHHRLAQRQQALLHSVEAINSSLTLRELLDEIIHRASAIAGGDALLGLLQGGELHFNGRAPETLPPPSDRLERQQWPHDALHDVLRTQEPLTLTRLPDRLLTRFASPGPSLVLPIVDASRGSLGILLLVRPAGSPPFREEEIYLLQTFAHQGAIALSKATLLQTEQEGRHLSEGLRRMSQALSAAAMEVGSMAEIVLTHLRELLAYDSASIALIDGAKLIFVASQGSHAPPEGEQFPLGDLHLSRWVIDHRRPLRLGDATEGPLQRSERFQLHRSWLGAPLIANNEVIGVLSCDCLPAHAYSERDEQITTAVADHAALALQNARLYENTRRLRDYYQQVVNSVEQVIFTTDGEGRLTGINERQQPLFSAQSNTLIGLSLAEVVAEPLHEKLLAMLQAIREGAEKVTVEVEWQTEGAPRVFQLDATPLPREEEGVVGVTFLSTEVTAQRETEEQMRQYLDGMLMVHRVGVMMGDAQDTEHLLALVCEQAMAISGARKVAVGLLTEEKPQALRIASAQGTGSDTWPGRVEPLDASIIEKALSQRQPFLLMPGVTSAADLERFLGHWQASNAVILPLEARNQVIGALLVFDRDQQRVGVHSLQLLQIFVSQAAVTIDNMHLLQEAQRRQAELEGLTEYNNLLIESSPVGKAVLDSAGRVMRVNPAFRTTVAPEDEHLEGKTLAQLFPQVERTTLAQMVHSVLERGVAHRAKAFYYPYLASGARWFDLSFTPLHDAHDRVTGVMMTLVDITPLKQLEEDLRQRNERIERQLAQHRALYEMGTQINAELDVQRVLEALMISVRSSFSVDGMTMLMPTEQPDRFDFVSAFGLSANYLAREQVLCDVSANGRAIAQVAPILIADIEQDERMGPLREAARQEGLHTALFLPFIYRDEVVGLMSLYHRQPHRYSLEEMELLAVFTNQATTAIKNAQFYTSIVQSRSNLNAILHSMTDGVIALDEQDCVIFINQPLFDLLNIPAATDWVGRSSTELWPQLRELLQTSSAEDPLTPVEGGGVLHMEIELLTPPRTLELIHSPILDEEGQRIGRLLLLHDITEIRASERMKDELISIISHELRTPLTTILGYSKLLLDRAESPLEKRNRWATYILDKSRLLNRLVNEMLDLSRLNMQRFEVKRAPTDLVELIRRAVKEHRPMTDKHLIQMGLKGDLSAVSVDADRIDQLLSNLLINAIKYSPKGGTILIRAVREGDWLRLSVVDQGLGIAPDYQQRIFEPFFRVDQSTTRDVYGTGLGLPLCQGIAEAHGGSITLESELGKGSTFTVHLPV